ncbi:MAG TPA: hypothetical protein VFA20_06835 [Myxococcaceae bacterium]|nr:hypothetical protein [Myxococcaceae bacterium]
MESILRKLLQTWFVAGVEVDWGELRRFLNTGSRSEALSAELRTPSPTSGSPRRSSSVD